MEKTDAVVLSIIVILFFGSIMLGVFLKHEAKMAEIQCGRAD